MSKIFFGNSIISCVISVIFQVLILLCFALGSFKKRRKLRTDINSREAGDREMLNLKYSSVATAAGKVL